MGIEANYPGLSAYLVEDNGALRQHVNIFINDTFIRDRKRLSDRVSAGDEVHVIQALSGG
jgi:molybdopterin converting factor small subunit